MKEAVAVVVLSVLSFGLGFVLGRVYEFAVWAAYLAKHSN